MTLMLLPGMPKWPIILIIGGLGLAWWRIRNIKNNSEVSQDLFASTDDEAMSKVIPPVEINLGIELAESWTEKETEITGQISKLRETHESKFGIAFPGVKIVENSDIGPQSYALKLYGTRYGRGEIKAESTLAIRTTESKDTLAGIETKDPVFGLPALWISPSQTEEAQALNWSIVDPVSLLTTHLGRLLEQEAPALLSRAVMVKLIDEVRDRQGGLVEELIPNALTISDVQHILKNLLSEGVSIAMICNQLQDNNADLAVISLDPKLENKITLSLQQAGSAEIMMVDPKTAQSLTASISRIAAEMINQGRHPVLLCGDALRRQMRAMTKRAIPQLSVLSVSEVPMNISLKSFDVIKLD